MVKNTTTRNIKNVTESRQSLQPAVAFREWFIPGHKSQLLGFRCSRGAEVFSDSEVYISTNRIRVQLVRPIELEPGDEFILWYEVEEPRRLNDIYVETFASPTISPRITVTYGQGTDGLVVNMGFGSTMQSRRTFIGKQTVELPGMLLGYGYIEVSWWPKADMNNWHQEEEGKGNNVVRQEASI